MTHKRDLTSEKKIVNNLGLPVFFMIIFHNCTTNKWYSQNRCLWLFISTFFVVLTALPPDFGKFLIDFGKFLMNLQLCCSL